MWKGQPVCDSVVKNGALAGKTGLILCERTCFHDEKNSAVWQKKGVTIFFKKIVTPSNIRRTFIHGFLGLNNPRQRVTPLSGIFRFGKVQTCSKRKDSGGSLHNFLLQRLQHRLCLGVHLQFLVNMPDM